MTITAIQIQIFLLSYISLSTPVMPVLHLFRFLPERIFCFSLSGSNHTRNVVVPLRLEACIAAPCPSVMFFAMARPSPYRPWCRLRESSAR